MPPMGTNSFVFACIFVKTCPRWRSAPAERLRAPPYGKSWVCHCEALMVDIFLHVMVSHSLRGCLLVIFISGCTHLLDSYGVVIFISAFENSPKCPPTKFLLYFHLEIKKRQVPFLAHLQPYIVPFTGCQVIGRLKNIGL